MELFEDLQWRGLIHQWTGEAELPALLRREPVTLYCGFDPSADSLHIGSLVQLTLLRRFQKAGHRPIIVAGGGTGMIGDPGGRSEERNLLGPEELARNVSAIRTQLERFVDFEAGERSAIVVNNADWLGELSVIDFLRDVGKHFSINMMLAKESVRARLESQSGISYTEFSYMLLQGYDFVELNRRYGCVLQTGGSDQYGNLVAGVELGRRMRGIQLYALTTPLITRSDGVKMGKTAAGAVWLDPLQTSPYAFYQWFVRLPDEDAGRFLRIFTELPHDEIEALEQATLDAPERREAQRRLARELTLLVHGEDGLGKAERATQALFGGSLEGFSEADLLEIFAEVPSAALPRARLADGLAATDALVESGLAKSKGEARRLLEGGGAYVSNRRLEGADAVLRAEHVTAGSVMVLRSGKRSFALLRFSG